MNSGFTGEPLVAMIHDRSEKSLESYLYCRTPRLATRHTFLDFDRGMYSSLGGRCNVRSGCEGTIVDGRSVMPRNLLRTKWIVPRVFIGTVLLLAFFINLRFFKSSDTANLIAGCSFIGAWLAFGMLRPTIFFIRCLFKLIWFYLVFLRY